MHALFSAHRQRAISGRLDFRATSQTSNAPARLDLQNSPRRAAVARRDLRIDDGEKAVGAAADRWRRRLNSEGVARRSWPLNRRQNARTAGKARSHGRRQRRLYAILTRNLDPIV